MPDRYGNPDTAEFDPYERDDRAAAMADRLIAISQCTLCDADGDRNGFACDHVDHRAAARRGMELIRQALAARYTDPDHPAVTDALTRRCDQCGAQPGQPCHNHITGAAQLPGRAVHHGRTGKP